MNRRHFVFWLVGLAVAAVLFSVASPTPADLSSEVSFTNARRNGVRALGLYLKQHGWRLHHEVTSPDALAPATSVLLLPPEVSRSLSGAEELALRDWLRDGGRLIRLAPQRSGGPRAQLSSLDNVEYPPRLQVRPVEASDDFPGVRELAVSHWRMRDDQPGWVARLRDEHGPIVVSRQHGKGEMIVLPDPSTLSNEGLREADNLAFALSLVAEPGRTDIGIYVRDLAIVAAEEAAVRAEHALPWSWRLAGVSLALGALAAFWLVGRRTGPILPPEPPPPRPLTEYVTAQAHAYRRAGAGSAALGFIAAGLRRDIAGRTGLPATAPAAALAEACVRLGIAPAEVESVLRQLEAGGHPHPRDLQKLAAKAAALQRRIRRVH